MLAIMLVQIDVKNQAGKITVRSVSSEVHSALLSLLRGISVPKKERTPHTIAAYRIKMRRIASCATVTNPLSGKMDDRVVIDSDSNGDRTILLYTKS